MEEKKRSYVALYNDMKCELIKEVGLSTAMVYLIIKSHKMIENNMHCCYPSNEDLYKECNLKKRQFQNHLTKLVDKGWIVVKSGGTKIGRNSNYYFPREIGMYTEAELNYISKIERRSTKKDNTVEEIPAQINEIIEDNIVADNKIKEFKPIGKYVDLDDDLFIEDEELNIPSVENNPLVGVDANDIYELDERLVKNNKKNKINITDEAEKKKLFNKWYSMEQEMNWQVDLQLREEIYKYSDKMIEEYTNKMYIFKQGNYFPRWKKQDIAI